MTSLADLATRNFTTVFALILIASPVCGLRPMRALRSAFTRRPMPGITNTPFFLVSLMAVSASSIEEGCGLLVGQFELLGHMPGKCGLGHSSCHVMFSFLLAARFGIAGIDGLQATARCVPHGSGANAKRVARNPCIHAGFEEPCRSLQCGFGGGKVNGKTRFSTVFLGF